MKLSVNSGLHHTLAGIHSDSRANIVRRTFHTNQRHTNTLARTHLVVIGHHLKATTYWIPISGGTHSRLKPYVRLHEKTVVEIERERVRGHTHTHPRGIEAQKAG